MENIIELRKEQHGILKLEAKLNVDNYEKLSLVYTPGVGSSCLAIKDDVKKSFSLTNRANTIAVFIVGRKNILKAERKAVLYNLEKNIDAIPIVLKSNNVKTIIKVLKNLVPSFSGYDLSLLHQNLKREIKINLEHLDLPLEYTNVMFSQSELRNLPSSVEIIDDDSVAQKSLKLHKELNGVVQTSLSYQNIDELYSDENIQLVQDEINKNVESVKTLTHIGNTVAVISDGSAVLGFGNIGAEAAIPVMEGKSVLFSSLGGVNAVPLCVKTQDVDEIVEIITEIADSFGGINLEDISAPRCFEVENRLKKSLDIPVFHDDQHGTAIVVLSAFINALKLTGKNIEEIKVVVNGAGAGASSVGKMLLKYGVKNLIFNDINGAVYRGREADKNSYLEKLALVTNPNNQQGYLKDLITDADFFIGLSVADVLTAEMIQSMAEKPVVFALANPVPEIMPDIAKEAGAFIVATGRSDFENQVNNSLAFPGVFKGALANKVSSITDKMKLNAAIAIASLISEEELSAEYILPKALDERVAQAVAEAIV